MKISFLTNYYNHHQSAISEKLSELTGNQFTFIATGRMGEARKKLGYDDTNMAHFVVDYKNIEANINNFIINNDVFIVGSAPHKYVTKILKNNKIIFRYTERLEKKKLKSYEKLALLLKERAKNPVSRPIYLLCASAYTSLDYRKIGLFDKKAYKWGYFPKTIKYDIDKLCELKSTNEILWCGRFLDWKHPDDVIYAINKLKKERYGFRLKFIGTGEQEQKLKDLVKELGLQDDVLFLGSMSPDKVRTHMESAGIYLFTSDRREGWGAVLNESMNSGCAVVASHLIGSVPYLIDDNENGMIYRSGDIEMLYEKIKYLLDHPEKQREYGKKAYETITNEWNAEVAAERLINLSEHIISGEMYPDLYSTGPCSKANIIYESWFDQKRY